MLAKLLEAMDRRDVLELQQILLTRLLDSYEVRIAPNPYLDRSFMLTVKNSERPQVWVDVNWSSPVDDETNFRVTPSEGLPERLDYTSTKEQSIKQLIRYIEDKFDLY